MDINWDEVWRKQLIQSMMPKPDAYAEWWDSAESARNYLSYYGGDKESDNDRVKWTIEQLNLKPDSRVLEIGSGPGVLSVPIAKKVAHVTVVEPSMGMLEVLDEYAHEEGISNIHRIAKRWEEVTDDDLILPYDVVFASMSLAMPDIKAALEKMNRYCSGTVTLIWFADEPGFEKIYRSVLPDITGKEYIPGPKADILFNLAYSMGLYPEVRYVTFSLSQKFADEKEIADFFRTQHRIQYSAKSEGFKRYLDENLIKTESGYEHEEKYHCMSLRWYI